MPHPYIVFYDGVCPMCNGWVKWVIRHDSQKVFRFASLQGNLAHEVLQPLFPDYRDLETIVYYEHGRILMRSTAVLRVWKRLPFPWNIPAALLIFPKGVRDAVYNLIARYRFTFNKPYSECPLPPAQWRDRFL